MKLVKYHPFHPYRTMSSLFGHMNNDWTDNQTMMQSPSVNIKESDEVFQVELAAPGLKKEDFSIEVKEDQLIIKVEKREEENKETDTYKRMEFKYSTFTKKFYLPNEVDAENIKANYSDGILNLIIPKMKQEELVKRIEIS